MKFRLLIALLLLATPLLANIQTTSDIPSRLATGQVAHLLNVEPGRDDGDSIHFSYGFEDGWNGWEGIDLTDAGNMWRVTDWNAFEGNSWWCGDPAIQGYNNHWLQYIVTPVLDLSEYEGEDIALTFKLRYDMEAPDGAEAPYDGWDGCNLWASVDGGQNWSVIEPVAPAYDRTSLYSFGEEWKMGAGIPGWCGSSGGWKDVTFDLKAYGGKDGIRFRWAFCSDPAYCTEDDGHGSPVPEAIGMFVDNLKIVAAGETIWENNADEADPLANVTVDRGPGSGNFWELSDLDKYEGSWSAHCPIQPDLLNALVSPPIAIPEDWYCYFDFYVKADMQMCESNGDEYLDELFRIEVSANNGKWQDMIYDYGRDSTWFDTWKYYGPGTWFRGDLEEWKLKLNLTQFAGDTIRLRWKLVTDSVMTEPQGTGLWIDNFAVHILSRKELDVKLSWLNVPYPTATNLKTNCSANITNVGMLSAMQISKSYRVNNDKSYPIVPRWDLDPDSSRTFTFQLFTIPYAYKGPFQFYTLMNGDGDRTNDTITYPEMVIYPDRFWMLGHDQRSIKFRYEIDKDKGPMVKFTPADNQIVGRFDMQALHVQWDRSEENIGAQVKLYIYADNAGQPGAELYSEEITLTAGDIRPNTHVVDVTQIPELKNLQGTFWVWFKIVNDTKWPQIVGDNIPAEVNWGKGHFFLYDGNELQELPTTNYNIRALLTPVGGALGTHMIPGRGEIDLGTIKPDSSLIKNVTIFNGGNTPLVIDSIRVDSLGFAVVDTALVLKVGEAFNIDVTFQPTEERDYEAYISVYCNDPNPVDIHLLGVGKAPLINVTPNAGIVSDFRLEEAFPNPFNPTTTMNFALPYAGNVTMALYDLNGREVARLIDGRMNAGAHHVAIDGTNLANGVYLVKLSMDRHSVTRKLVLAK